MIKGIIVLDGPDAAGKTTLAEHLIEMNQGNGVILHATYRFKDKIPIYHGVLLRKAIRFEVKSEVESEVLRSGTEYSSASSL